MIRYLLDRQSGLQTLFLFMTFWALSLVQGCTGQLFIHQALFRLIFKDKHACTNQPKQCIHDLAQSTFRTAHEVSQGARHDRVCFGNTPLLELIVCAI